MNFDGLFNVILNVFRSAGCGISIKTVCAQAIFVISHVLCVALWPRRMGCLQHCRGWNKALTLIRGDFQFSVAFLLISLWCCCCCGHVSTSQLPFFSIGTINCINELDGSRAQRTILLEAAFPRYRTKDLDDEHVKHMNRSL